MSTFLLATAMLAALPLQAKAAVILQSVQLQANHDLADAYLLIGDASGPASSVGVFKLGDYLVGTGSTVTILPPALTGDWHSGVFNGDLKSLGLTPQSTITYAVLGIYNISAPAKDITVSLSMSQASSVIGNGTWNDEFATGEQDVVHALIGNDIPALQSFFIADQQNGAFATISEQGHLVKFCVGHDGGTVDLVTVPEPAMAGLAVIGMAGLVLRRRRGNREP